MSRLARWDYCRSMHLRQNGSSARARKWALMGAVALASLAACGPRHQNLVERRLRLNDDLACAGFLVWNREPVRDVFLVINGSGNGSSAFVHPSFDELLRAHAVAYATYDKPGLSAPFDDPAAVRRDDAGLQRYTMGHGIECAKQALRWGRERFGPSARLHLRGHSEGTLVSLYAYAALLDEDPELAAAIKTLVLSGLALEPLHTILERQLAARADGPRIRQALASCDWPVLQERLGVSCAYVADAAGRPSGAAMFEALAARTAPASIQVLHGTDDWNTPVESVRALEAWNASQGHLPMTFHYYKGGHAGTAEGRAQLHQILTAIVSP